MRRLAAGAVVLLAMTSCSRGTGVTPDERPDSGVRGVVLLGPQCPVESLESPCPDEPWSGTIRATRGDDSVEGRTGDDGRFELRLAPGMWTVAPVLEGGGPPSARPVTIRVEPDAFADVTLTVDTGIR